MHAHRHEIILERVGDRGAALAGEQRRQLEVVRDEPRVDPERGRDGARPR